MWALIRGSRARLVFLVLAVGGGYFAYTAINDAIETSRVEEERLNAEREVAALVEKKKELEGVKQYAGSDAFVEQESRRRLGFVRYGEVPVVVISPPPPVTNQPDGDWWQRRFPR